MLGSLILATFLGAQPCPLPIYLKNGVVRCADHPASTAFGKLTWIEDGRRLTIPASKVDLERTMAIHKKARRPNAGGFSMMGDAAAPEHPEGTAPQTAPMEWPKPPSLAPPQPSPQTPQLTREQRTELQTEMQRLQSEQSVLWKRYKMMLALGVAPSNTISSAINARIRRVEYIQAQLDRQ